MSKRERNYEKKIPDLYPIKSKKMKISARKSRVEDQKCLIGFRDDFHCYRADPCLVRTNNGMRCTKLWQDRIPNFWNLRNIVDLT